MKKGLYYHPDCGVICFGMIPKKIKKYYELIPHIAVNVPKSLIRKLIDRIDLNGDIKTLCLSTYDINENQFFKIKHAFEKGVINIMFYNSKTKLKVFTTIKTFKIKDLTPKLYTYGIKYIYDTSCLK